MWLGPLIEPPISVPQPIRAPDMANKAASPPDEPPGVSSGLPGYVVKPQSGLSVSPHWARVSGRLVKRPVRHVAGKRERSYQYTLRNGRLRNEYRSKPFQDGHENGILFGRLASTANVA